MEGVSSLVLSQNHKSFPAYNILVKKKEGDGLLAKGATISLVLRKNIIIVSKDTTFELGKEHYFSLSLDVCFVGQIYTLCCYLPQDTYFQFLSVNWIMQLNGTSSLC